MSVNQIDGIAGSKNEKTANKKCEGGVYVYRKAASHPLKMCSRGGDRKMRDGEGGSGLKSLSLSVPGWVNERSGPYPKLALLAMINICKPTGGDASVRDAKNWMGAWDSETKNCPADSDHLLISDTEERSVCALRDETRVVGWVRGTDSCEM